MEIMAKRKPKPPKEEKMPSAAEAVSTPYRPSDPRILDQLDKLKVRDNRPSRNNTIDTLVLRGLAAEGLWPPKADAE